MEIWIAGQPHKTYGGANTEAIANIELLREHGVDVHLVPMNPTPPSPDLVQKFVDIGCHIHEYEQGIFSGKTVAAWGCETFLNEQLACAGRVAPPARVLFFNCMTFVPNIEAVCHMNKLITHYGYVSEYQKAMLAAQFVARALPQELIGYAPPFTDSSKAIVKFFKNYPGNEKGVGHISRDDPTKISPYYFNIDRRINERQPHDLHLGGWGERCELAFRGHETDHPRIKKIPVETISVPDFYGNVCVMFHRTGGSRESFCRACIESWLNGIPFVTEKDFAFPEIYGDGVLRSLLCNNENEFSEVIAQLIDSYRGDRSIYDMFCDEQKRRYYELNLNGRCWAAWEKFL